MIKKPFTLNTKRLGLMASSAAIVVAMAAPVALADEPGLDTPIDDSLEEIVQPSDEDEPEPGLDTPIEEPPAEDEPVEEDPTPDPEPGDDTPIEEPPAEDEPVEEDPTPDPEPGEDEPIEEDPGDTGTEPDPTPVPVVPPVDEDPEPSDDDTPDDDAAGPIRVTINYVDQDGNVLSPAVGLRGEIGASYFAENAEIEGYEVTGVEGPVEGTFGEDVVQVTYTYMLLSTDTPVDPAPTPTDDEPGDDTPIDDSGEELDPPAESGDDEPSDTTPVDDSGEEFDDIVPPVADGDSDETPIDDTREGVKEKDDDKAIDDTRESLKDEDESPIAGTTKESGGTGSTKDAGSKDGDLKAIPQASAETNWGMIGAGFAALGAAAAMLFGRREKSGTTNE